jgi:hypothetical protein
MYSRRFLLRNSGVNTLRYCHRASVLFSAGNGNRRRSRAHGGCDHVCPARFCTSPTSTRPEIITHKLANLFIKAVTTLKKARYCWMSARESSCVLALFSDQFYLSKKHFRFFFVEFVIRLPVASSTVQLVTFVAVLQTCKKIASRFRRSTSFQDTFSVAVAVTVTVTVTLTVICNP